MNSVQIVGRLGNDPEVRFFQDGTPVINFSVATSRKWKDKNGEKKEKTTWLRCVKTGKGADTLATYLRKGSLVGVEGRIDNREWKDKDDQKHSVMEIVVEKLEFLEGKRSDGAGQAYEPAPDLGPAPDDDVPF